MSERLWGRASVCHRHRSSFGVNSRQQDMCIPDGVDRPSASASSSSSCSPTATMKPPSFLVSCALVPLLCLLHLTNAQPATLSFSDCASGEIPSQQINISSVYGQIITDDSLGKHLNLTLVGASGAAIIPISTVTGLEGTSDLSSR